MTVTPLTSQSAPTGPAFNEGGAYGYISKGGTGAAVRTLVQIALDVADGRFAGGSGQAEAK